MKKTVKMTVAAITPGGRVIKDKDGKAKGTEPVVAIRFAGEGTALNLTGLAPEDAKGLAYGQEVSVTITA